MNPLARSALRPLCGLAILALVSCASAPVVQRTIVVEVSPPNALVTLSTFSRAGARVQEIATKRAVDGRAQFAISIVGPAAYDNTLYVITADVAGYNQARETRFATNLVAPVVLQLGKSLATQRQERAAEAVQRRARYLAEHPATPPDVARAIHAGQLVAGMDGAQASAALGYLHLVERSNSALGESTTYSHSADLSIHYLFFRRGRLTYWTETPRS